MHLIGQIVWDRCIVWAAADIDGRSEAMNRQSKPVLVLLHVPLVQSSFQFDAKEEILETVSKLVRHQADGVPHIQVDQLEGGGDDDDDDDDDDQLPHIHVQLKKGFICPVFNEIQFKHLLIFLFFDEFNSNIYSIFIFQQNSIQKLIQFSVSFIQ